MSAPINELKTEVKTQVTGYIVAALGLVAGLAWNDAIKTAIEFFFPTTGGNSIWAKFIYALLITAFVVVITLLLAKTMRKNDQS
jgi:glycerol uptake facilitator-like aquaporin